MSPLSVRLELVSSADVPPAQGLALRLASQERSEAKSFIDFTFTPARGPFHNLPIKLVSTSAKLPSSTSISFRLSVVTPTEPSNSNEDLESQRIRTLVKEPNQPILETWDDKRYIFLSVDSGTVAWDRRSQANISKDKGLSIFLNRTFHSAHLPLRRSTNRSSTHPSRLHA